MLGGRTGVVMSALALLLLAGGVSRGKRIAWQFTSIVLVASIGFDLVKDLDFEDAALSAWILIGLWWFRGHFQANSDPRRLLELRGVGWVGDLRQLRRGRYPRL